MEPVMPVSKVNRDEPREYDRTRLDKAKEEKELGGCLVGTRGRSRCVLMHFEMRGSRSGVTSAERRGYDYSQRIQRMNGERTLSGTLEVKYQSICRVSEGISAALPRSGRFRARLESKAEWLELCDMACSCGLW